MYKYVNQKDPKNEAVFGTHYKWGDLYISKGGCGLCSASMVVENLTGKPFPLPQVIKMAKEWGYQNSGKVMNDFKVLAPVIAEDFHLKLQMTNDPEELLEWMNNGGMAIIHLTGDRDGRIGIMSNGGHYVTAVKAEGRKLTILDPSLVPGKYDVEGRKEYVTVNGNECYCDVDIITDGCKGWTPYFFMFAEKK